MNGARVLAMVAATTRDSDQAVPMVRMELTGDAFMKGDVTRKTGVNGIKAKTTNVNESEFELWRE